ncbi:MAG TPA: Hsp20/alpha crystallin family protein [Armatimonadota bacterium]|nr:Hsp20/alpha crystallin family protein [Armatimonadota bacterium]
MFKDYDEIIREMEREMQRLADQAFAGLVKLSEGPDRFWRPRADVYETADHILVVVEVAGLDKNRYQISLDIEENSLVVKGNRVEMPSDRTGRLRCHQIEIYFGAFERTISLPEGAPIDRDGVEATYKDGLLRVALPRRRTPAGQLAARQKRGDSEISTEDPSED